MIDFLLDFFPFLFLFLKFTLVGVLFTIGTLILLRLRGIYLQQKAKGDYMNTNKFMRKIRLLLGFSYIIIGFGFLFNYLTYILIWLFSCFDGFLLIWLNSLIDIFPEFLNNITSFIEIYHPIIAILSFTAILQYIMAFFYLVNNNKVISNPKKSVNLLVISSIEIILFGMECLPYFL